MALRRSGVRIPLGPLQRAISEAGRSYAIMGKIFNKVRTGVVGHPVSELGKKGASPARRIRERHPDRTRLLSLKMGNCAGESCSQRRASPLQRPRVTFAA